MFSLLHKLIYSSYWVNICIVFFISTFFKPFLKDFVFEETVNVRFRGLAFKSQVIFDATRGRDREEFGCVEVVLEVLKILEEFCNFNFAIMI
jgi:hypothetical protein